MFEVAGGDEFDEYEDDLDPAPPRRSRSGGAPPRRGSPKRRSAPPARKSKKRSGKKRRSSGPNWTVIGISAGGGVVVLILLIVLMLNVFTSSAESLMEDMVEDMDDFVTVMEGITDEASAKAAATKISRIGDRMVETFRKARKLDETNPPTPEEEKALKKKFDSRMKEITKCRMAAMRKLQKIPGAREAIQGAMLEMAGKMTEASREFRNSKRSNPLF